MLIYMFVGSQSSCQEEVVVISLYGFTPSRVCACHNTGPKNHPTLFMKRKFKQ